MVRARRCSFHPRRRWFTGTVRDGLLRHRLVRPDRLVHAPYGVAAEFAPAAAPVELQERIDRPFLLHVGGDMPRKRLDVLLDVFAALRSGTGSFEILYAS